MKKLVVIGAGGFGREVLDIARDQQIAVAGVLDDSPSDRDLKLLADQRIAFLGSVQDYAQRLDSTAISYVIGVGSGSARERIDRKMIEAGFEAATLVHSTATRGFGVVLGAGTVLCAGVRLTTNITTGRHTHVNLNATIGHDVRMASYVSINPGAAVSGNVSIGLGASIGANAFVLQGLSIGAASVVGASAAVVRNVQEAVTVAGVPARRLSASN